MSLETIHLPLTGEVVIPETLQAEVLEATNDARFWDAYQLALTAGPLENWSGPDAKLLAARLARHLGSSTLYCRLTTQAWREKPRSTRFLMQRIYAVMEQRGILAAWKVSQKLADTEADTEEDRADAFICQGFCQTVFRDFDAARENFSQAQTLAPESPWIWSESSSLPAEQGDYAAALELVEHALTLKPWARSALQRKAHYLQSLRRDEEAFQLLQDGRQHLQSGAVINQLIVMCSEREEWALMLELLDQAEGLLPFSEEGGRAWFAARRADAYIGLGRRSEAAHHARLVKKIKLYGHLAESLETESTPQRRVKIPVPFIQQDYNTCAPATLAAITTFWADPIAQNTLIGEICYDGTYDFTERRWAEQAGWHAREFKVTWDAATALLDRGIPFILTTVEINSAHSQAVIGYDTVRRSLLLRDPSVRHFTESGWEEFEKHYSPVGPRGLLLLPPAQAEAASDLTLPEAELFDLSYALNTALDKHDRDRAQEILQSLAAQEPSHRLTWMAKRAMANYDQNPLAHLEAVDGLLQLFPEDDRLLNTRLQLLRVLGRGHEAAELLRARCKRPDVPYLFRREYARELRQEKNKSGAAFRMTLQALKSGPTDIDNLTALSGIIWTAQQRQESLAIQHLAACVGDKKEWVAESYFQMKEACGQTEPGLEFLRKRAIHFLKQSGAPTITLINALDRLNRSAEARQVFEDALTQRPDDGDLHLRLAQFEAACGRLEESRGNLDRAQASTRPVPWLRAAGFLERLIGNFDQSLAHWQRLIELSPIDLEAHRQIASLLARRDGNAAGQDYVRSLGQRFPFHRGILETELGWTANDAPEAAEQRLSAYLEANPNDAWARREKALLLQNRRALGEALTEAQEARHCESYLPVSWQVEASILESLGQSAEARSHLKRALELDIDSPYSIRRLTFLADTVHEKREALRFIRGQFDQQSVSGPAITVYREVAFPILELADLTADLEAIWQQRPELWESWHALLLQYIATGRLGEAGQIANGATERFPTLPAIWRDAARMNERLGAWAEAMACLQHALRINPDWAPLICDLAEVHRRGSQWAEATELLERSHHRNPLEATILGTWADLMWHRGEREEALAKVKRAVEINPEYRWGWNTLSYWGDLLHHRTLALDMARERAQRLERDASAWLLVAHLAHRPEQAGERLDAALRARDCEPRNADAHDVVALALAEQRRYAEAISACHPAAFGDRIPYSLRGREAWLLAQQDKDMEAMEKMKEVVTTDPHYYWGWDRLADWYYNANLFHDSLKASETIVRLTPLDAKAYGKRARVFQKLTKLPEARLDFEKALALDPSYGFAGWQLFEMQIDDKDFSGATATLALMRAHTSPGIMLPGEIILAAKQRRWKEALKLLEQTAVLLEVDTWAVQKAIEALEAGGQRSKINKVFKELLSNPELNPFIAGLWADRIELVTRWTLYRILKKIPSDSRALEAVLKHLVLNSEKALYPTRLIKKLVALYPEATRKNTAVWAVIGQIYFSGRASRKGAHWLQDWELRPDTQGWMVTNYVFALQTLRRTPEADAVSEKLLSRGLRDHTSAFHLIYLALSALERHETGRARELLQGAHMESQNRHDISFKLAVEQALLVQEAKPGRDRRVAGAEARQNFVNRGMPEIKVQRVLMAEARASLLIARDSGSFLAWVYALHVNAFSQLSYLGGCLR